MSPHSCTNLLNASRVNTALGHLAVLTNYPSIEGPFFFPSDYPSSFRAERLPQASLMKAFARSWLLFSSSRHKLGCFILLERCPSLALSCPHVLSIRVLDAFKLLGHLSPPKGSPGLSLRYQVILQFVPFQGSRNSIPRLAPELSSNEYIHTKSC